MGGYPCAASVSQSVYSRGKVAALLLAKGIISRITIIKQRSLVDVARGFKKGVVCHMHQISRILNSSRLADVGVRTVIAPSPIGQSVRVRTRWWVVTEDPLDRTTPDDTSIRALVLLKPPRPRLQSLQSFIVSAFERSGNMMQNALRRFAAPRVSRATPPVSHNAVSCAIAATIGMRYQQRGD